MAKVAGETITLTAQYTNDAGNNTSPSTPVQISVKKPDGTLDVDDTTVAEDGSTTGLFEYTYTATDSGIYNYKFVSSDGAIEQGTFSVNVDKVG